VQLAELGVMDNYQTPTLKWVEHCFKILMDHPRRGCFHLLFTTPSFVSLHWGLFTGYSYGVFENPIQELLLHYSKSSKMHNFMLLIFKHEIPHGRDSIWP
jgi:hypothetical protein